MKRAVVVYFDRRQSTVLFRAPRKFIGAKTILATLVERCPAGRGQAIDEYVMLSESTN